MPGLFSRVNLVLSMALVLSLAACHKPAGAADDNAATAGTGTDVALPKPQANGGSVTGMPSKPGPNPIGPAPATSAGAVAPVETSGTPETNEAGEVASDAAAGDTAPAAVSQAEPSAQDALTVLQDYYAAINQRDFQRAWSSWSDDGRSSGQTAQQFADGFSNTAQVMLQAGMPGPVGAAAGSRYVEIPVTIQATQRDGTVRRYAGTYTLRRAVVDGATEAQRAWHIASAALHDAGP